VPDSLAARLRGSLALRVVIGVAVGTVLGAVFGQDPWLFGVSNADLGPIGMLVVRALKALATPLILVAVLDSFYKTDISGRNGLQLAAVCLVNVTIAMTFGLCILNVVHPGEAWVGKLEALLPFAGKAPESAGSATLSPLQNFAAFVPVSLVDPFSKNLVISVVLVAVLLGAALRSVRDGATGSLADASRQFEGLVELAYATLTKMLLWVADLMPWAVCLIVADVVGRAGVGVFLVLQVFFFTILAGLLLQALGWYPVLSALCGLSPRRFFRAAVDPVVTAVSCNSSLATMPVTLRALAGLGVRERSARLSACVGTNFNNDGVMLYEAMATLFLCQALGFPLDASQQLTIVLASIMAGVGIAGIPEAGLVILPLVLTAAGIPDAMVAVAIPLIVPVDWVLARVRSGVNVLADMVVAIALDRLDGSPTADTSP
jgi:DAACS family dicarboxylate/amino acid:cation (Na+ or H+) symporter